MSYTPTQWNTGDVITAERLNKAEQGIKEAHDIPVDISSEVADWLDEHINITEGVNIDGTLSVAGSAADAKATGDEISDLKSSLPYETNCTQIELTGGAYVTNNKEVGEVVDLTPVASNVAEYAIVDCAAGDVFFITGKAWNSERLWAFVDVDNKLVLKSASAADMTQRLLVAPAAGKLVCNFSINSARNLLRYRTDWPIDGLKMISNLDGLIASSGRKLANIKTNCIFSATSSYFSDIPSGAGGGVFVNLVYGNYMVQIYLTTGNGTRYERIVKKSDGSVYRDWRLGKSTTDLQNAVLTRFSKKTLYATGDSIMLGRTTGSAVATVTLPKEIGDRYLLTVTNAAVGGDTIAHREDGASVYDRITKVDLSAIDYLLMNGGTNDYGYGSALGTPDGSTSADVSTICGAMKAIFEYAWAQNPHMRIMVITPTFRNYVAKNNVWVYGNSYTTVADGGYTMNELSDAMIAVCKQYGVPVFDSRFNSPINQVNYETTLHPTAEGSGRYLHPTDTTYKQYAESVASWFASVM